MGFPDLGDTLGGQTAIVTGESDVCAAAKVLKTFSAEFQRPAVKVGVLDHAVISKEQIQTLAELPAKPVLQAQLLGVLIVAASETCCRIERAGRFACSIVEGKSRQKREAHEG